ncbi:hypothetical protein TNCV_1626241 [Trichonephila clavipes]|nr:hypothetical protein TNCV_1626241 [Trichonephila clavipes]
MVIGARLAGASGSRIANLVGVSRTIVSRVMTACTNLDNVRDEHPPSEPRIHENYSTRVAYCEHPRQSSYSKTVSVGAECCKDIIVVPRPPKLDATAMGTSQLV